MNRRVVMPEKHLMIEVDFRNGEVTGSFNHKEVKWMEVVDALEAIVMTLRHRSLKPPAFVIFDSNKGVRCG
jgi:hypothetical protein